MNDDSHDDDRGKRLDASMLQRFDQELQEVRSLFDKLEDGEREQLQLWLQQLTDANTGQIPRLPMSLMVHTIVTHQDDDDRVNPGPSQIAPHVLLKAVEAWRRGEDFLPASWMETV